MLFENEISSRSHVRPRTIPILKNPLENTRRNESVLRSTVATIYSVRSVMHVHANWQFPVSLYEKWLLTESSGIFEASIDFPSASFPTLPTNLSVPFTKHCDRSRALPSCTIPSISLAPVSFLMRSNTFSVCPYENCHFRSISWKRLVPTIIAVFEFFRDDEFHVC